MNDVRNIRMKPVMPEVVVTFEGEQFKFKHNIPPDLLIAFLLDSASALVKQQNKDKSSQPVIWRPAGANINAV